MIVFPTQIGVSGLVFLMIETNKKILRERCFACFQGSCTKALADFLPHSAVFFSTFKSFGCLKIGLAFFFF
jgi:hypothetical protein